MTRVSVVEIKSEEVDPWVNLFSSMGDAIHAVRGYMLGLIKEGIIQHDYCHPFQDEPHRLILRHAHVEFIITEHKE
jgi:hypothetical protein